MKYGKKAKKLADFPTPQSVSIRADTSQFSGTPCCTLNAEQILINAWLPLNQKTKWFVYDDPNHDRMNGHV
jgi:hypothetical protein